MFRKLLAAALLGAAFTAPAAAVTVVTPGASEGVQTDLFNGATVLSNSALLNGFFASSAFGATNLAPDYDPETTSIGTRVIFAGSGNEFINFMTAAPVTIAGFNIYLSSDGVGTPFRGLNSAGLSYSLDSGATFISLGSIAYDPTLGPVTVTGTFAPVTASYFRFDGIDNGNGGARLLEIDAIAAAVPEPASWAMMVLGFGLAGFALRSRRPARTFA